MKYVLMTQLLAQVNEPYEMPIVLKEPEVITIEKVTGDNADGANSRSYIDGNIRADSDNDSDVSWLTFEATAYTATCEGCIGITKTGIDVRNTTRHNGRHIIAVDPAVVPLGSVVQIRLTDGRTLEASAEDVGGAIRGQRLDLLVGDYDSAIQFGRQSVELRILN